MLYLINWGELLICQQCVSRYIVLFVVFLHEWRMSRYQDNSVRQKSHFFKALVLNNTVLQTIVSDWSCSSLCPVSSGPPGFTVAQPTVSRQHGALLPTVPLGTDWHQTPLCPTSLPAAYLTVAAHSDPHCLSHTGSVLCPSLTCCPPVAPWLYLPYHLLPTPCPHHRSPLPWSEGSRQSSWLSLCGSLCFVLWLKEQHVVCVWAARTDAAVRLMLT